MKEEIEEKTRYKKKELLEEIARKRGTTEKQKSDTQIILEEAYVITDKVGIREVPFNLDEKAINIEQSSLYYRGTIALSEEIEASKMQEKQCSFYYRVA